MRTNSFKYWLATRKANNYVEELGANIVKEISKRLESKNDLSVCIRRLDDAWQSESLAFNSRPIIKIVNSPFEIAFDVITWTSFTGYCKGLFFRHNNCDFIAMGSKLEANITNKEWNNMKCMFETLDFDIKFDCNN